MVEFLVPSTKVRCRPPFPGLRRGLASKRYSIVLADRSTGVVRRFTISLKPALGTVAFLFALPVLMGLGARWSAQTAINELERSNVALQVENASYKEATGELATQISSLQSAVDEIGVRSVVDPEVSRAMEKLPAIVKSRAMGGGTSESLAGPLLGSAFGAPDNTFGVLRELLGAIEGRLDSVRRGVEKRQALAAATPSIWPVPGWLSSGYGNRRDPFTGDPDFHPGLDISADYGQPVHATADGTVDERRDQRQLRQPRRHRSRLRPHDPLRSPLAIRRDHRPADSSRRRHRLCRFHRPLDQPAPALRDPRQRPADQPAETARRTLGSPIADPQPPAPQSPSADPPCLL